MRKIEIGVVCIALCIGLALIFPQLGKSNELVSDAVCLLCHDLGSAAVADTETLHGLHPDGNDCFKCHDEALGTGEDTVPSSNCLACHPVETGGNVLCDLVDNHIESPEYDPEGNGADSCLTSDCHIDDCGDTTETTTTAAAETTTTAAGCPSQKIYGVNSEEVQILRFVRDNILTATPEGREIIRLYYQLSPAIVAAMQNDPAFEAEVKAMTDGVLQLVVQ